MIRVNRTQTLNRLELLNEWNCGAVLIWASSITLVSTPEQRLFYGWLLLGQVAFGMLVNLGIVLYSIFYAARLKWT